MSNLKLCWCEENTDCTICKFYKLISREINQLENDKAARMSS